MDLKNITAAQLRRMLDSKEIGAKEAASEFLSEIKKNDGKVLSFITVTEDEAMKNAEAAQKRIDAGNAAPLTGIPIALKDNLCTDGIRTTCSSKMLGDFVPPYNATAVEKLIKDDYTLLGKVSMDEFAMGGSTQTSAFAKTKNPYNTECVPGGSSGGSAAAVSAGFCTAALGSDTGGSPARVVLRSYRSQTHLRACFEIRACGIRKLPRPDRPDRKIRRGLRNNTERHSRRGSPRRHKQGRAFHRLQRKARKEHIRHEDRYTEGILRRCRR